MQIPNLESDGPRIQPQAEIRGKRSTSGKQEEEIELCHYRLSEIHRYIKGLQADSIPDNDPVYDVLEEKSCEWLHRWELLAAMDPRNRHLFQNSKICNN